MINVLYDYLRKQFKQTGNGLIQLIWIHILCFILLCIFHTFCYICGYSERIPVFYEKLTFSSLDVLVLERPWTLITYSFVHNSLLGLCGNMLMLYTFGQSMQSVFPTKRIIYLYCLGQIAGACTFFILYQFSPPFKGIITDLSGPLPAIYAIMVAVCVLIPGVQANFFFISLPLRVVVAMLLLWSFMQLTNNHAGYYVAQLGGALIGYVYAKIYKNNGGDNGSFGGITRFIRLNKTTLSLHINKIKKR